MKNNLEEINKLLIDILESCNNKKLYKKSTNEIISRLCDIERANILKLYKHYLNIFGEAKEAINKCRNRIRISQVKGKGLFNINKEITQEYYLNNNY
jgi:hypothetical protein